MMDYCIQHVLNNASSALSCILDCKEMQQCVQDYDQSALLRVAAHLTLLMTVSFMGLVCCYNACALFKKPGRDFLEGYAQVRHQRTAAESLLPGAGVKSRASTVAYGSSQTGTAEESDRDSVSSKDTAGFVA